LKESLDFGDLVVLSGHMKNEWIADRGYGTGMALAFQGDAAFITQSINFAVNFLLSPRSHIKEQTASFVIINTTMEELVKALEFEGYCRKMLELHKAQPAVEFDVEDLPEDFDQKCEEFIMKTLAGVDYPEPTAGLMPAETPEMVKEAKAAGVKYAQVEVAKIRFEDFMRRVSRAGLAQHAVTDTV